MFGRRLESLGGGGAFFPCTLGRPAYTAGFGYIDVVVKLFHIRIHHHNVCDYLDKQNPDLIMVHYLELDCSDGFGTRTSPEPSARQVCRCTCVYRDNYRYRYVCVEVNYSGTSDNGHWISGQHS